jgi:hypothetical protein
MMWAVIPRIANREQPTVNSELRTANGEPFSVTPHALIRQQWWRITQKDGGKTQSKKGYLQSDLRA